MPRILAPRPKSFYRHMNPQKAVEIRDLYFAHVFKQTDLAEIYGVRQSGISGIVSEMVWAHPSKGAI